MPPQDKPKYAPGFVPDEAGYAPGFVPEDPTPNPPGKSIGGFVSNAWESAKKNLNPIEGAKGVFRLAKGISDTFDVVSPKTAEEEGLRNFPQALASDYKNAYGGWENIKNTLYEDPVRVLLDASMLASPAAAGTRAAGYGNAANKIAAVGKTLDVPQKAAEFAGNRLVSAGRRAQRRAVSPPASILNKMAEARGMTEGQLGYMLADDSHQLGFSPSGADVVRLKDSVNADNANRLALETAAQYGDKTIDVQQPLVRAARQTFSTPKAREVLPDLETGIRPTPRKEATKNIFRYWGNEHPSLTKPRMPVATERMGDELLRNVEFDIQPSAGRVPDREAMVPVVGQNVRKMHAEQADSWGLDASGKAEVEASKPFSHELSKEVDAATKDFVPEGGKSWADLGSDMHRKLNLLEALRHRAYNSANAPVRLYEFLGLAAGDPSIVALGAASRPPVLWQGGKWLRNTGDAAKAAAQSPASEALVRAAILSQFGQNTPR